MDECPICYESMQQMLTVAIPCSATVSHRLCLKCFIHLEKKECPLCRGSFEHLIPPMRERSKLTLVQFIREIPTLITNVNDEDENRDDNDGETEDTLVNDEDEN
jgi:hypothetical protein